jgi:DNA-binding transcriptional MerR regulator
MMNPQNELPTIPEKRYFSIGETSILCGVQPYVLRYWETEFSELRPSKRRGNRRYYQLKDVLMIRKIRHLLYDRGYTINGARQQLAEEKAKAVSANIPLTVHAAIKELEDLLESLESPENGA